MASLTSPLGLPLRGARKPRVETHPEYVDSFGAETAELMVRAGRPLDDWQQDSVSLILAVRGDGKWACFEYCEWVTRQNGKGGILEARALAGFLLLGEQLIMWSAHEYKTAMEAFRRVRALIKALGRQVGDNENLFEFDKVDENGQPATFLVKINNTNGEEGFERLDTEARIKFIARSKGSGRGFSGNCNIIDEAYALTTDQHQALLYTVSAIPNAQIIYASSPPLTGDTGAVMYALRHRGDPTAPRTSEDGPWEQDPSLGYRDYGLGGDLDCLDGIDLDDKANWAATNPSLEIRRSNGTGQTVEGIAREKRAAAADLPGWARERLGIWPRQIGGNDGGWRVITEPQWLARLDLQAVMGDPHVLAAQVDPEREWAGIVAAGPRVAGGRVLDVVDVVPAGLAISRLAELAARHSPVAIVCGDKALGDAAEGRGLRIIRAGTSDLAAAAGTLYDAVAGAAPDVWQLGQSQMTAAVRQLAKRTAGDRWRWDESTPGAYLVTAGSLALWALGTPRLHTPSQTPFALT